MALKKGDRVKVMNMTHSGELIEEGIATLMEERHTKGLWIVLFDGDHPDSEVCRYVEEKNRVE